jgi:hypothetical protein
MFCHKCKCCCYSWFSGFFALAAIPHIVRSFLKFPVQIGSFVVPMNLSYGIAIVATILSLTFCKLGCKACNCAGK